MKTYLWFVKRSLLTRGAAPCGSVTISSRLVFFDNSSDEIGQGAVAVMAIMALSRLFFL